MRAIIVMYFVSMACADKLGYNYKPVPHSDRGLSFTPGSEIISSGGLASTSFGNNGANNAARRQEDIGFSSSESSNDISYSVPKHTTPAEIKKEFYTFSAPANVFNDDNAQQAAGSVKKGIRVIFIKSPENNGFEKAALALAKQAGEQKTAIYVLSKQTDIGDLADKFNEIKSNSNNRPEVHFVKYRTPDDARNAQKAIKSQYDSLGGSSKISSSDVAPVLNFASKNPIRNSPAQTPGSSYLPSSIFRL